MSRLTLAMPQTQQQATNSSIIRSHMLQHVALTPVHGSVLQRRSNGVEGPECRQKRLEREGTLQRAAVNSAPTNGVPPIVHDVLNSPGQPLDTGTRAFMEPRFGHDFSGVRVHTDGKAAESAKSVNALAYTVGRNVVFGTGQYAPGTGEGRRLLAHELTHVVQQRNVPSSSIFHIELDIAPSYDTYEKEADEHTDNVIERKDINIHNYNNINKKMLQRQIDQKCTNIYSSECNMTLIGVKPLKGVSIFFDKLSCTVDATEEGALNLFVIWWGAGPKDMIVLDGYASVDGPEDLNIRLSCARAEAVKAGLIRRGVPAAKIVTVAHGETNEFSSTDLAKNRRVVISVHYRGLVYHF